MAYFISDNYNDRVGAVQDFEGEATTTDDYQKEVYEAARRLADLNGYQSIFDFGCGGGFKLMKYFSDFLTKGFDLSPAVKLLRKKYPDRLWVSPHDISTAENYDLVICSDVIEHVDDPDWLCEYIKLIHPKHVVISTPDRDLVCEHHDQPSLGPPRNLTHVREWSFEEFKKYMDSHFAVEDMFYSNKDQYTICVVAHLK